MDCAAIHSSCQVYAAAFSTGEFDIRGPARQYSTRHIRWCAVRLRHCGAARRSRIGNQNMICKYGTPRLTGICRNVPGLACEVYYADLTAARMIAEGKPRKRAHVRQARGSVTTIV